MLKLYSKNLKYNRFDRPSPLGIDFLKQNTLFFIYSFTFKTWLKDESEDLSSTMAELDRLLTFSEKAEKKIKNFFPICSFKFTFILL